MIYGDLSLFERELGEGPCFSRGSWTSVKRKSGSLSGMGFKALDSTEGDSLQAVRYHCKTITAKAHRDRKGYVRAKARTLHSSYEAAASAAATVS